MSAIAFSVPGDPVPQPRARITTRGGHGHAYTPASHAIHAYRAKPTDAAPLTLIVDLVFARPKSHYRKSGLRSDAPTLPRPDCSNCLKGIEDSLNGVAWVDDSQVGRVVIEKSYGSEGRTTVRIS